MDRRQEGKSERREADRGGANRDGEEAEVRWFWVGGGGGQLGSDGLDQRQRTTAASTEEESRGC